MKTRILACLFGAAAAAACVAHADVVRTDAVTASVQCSLDDAAAVACRMSDSVAADGTHTMEFAFGEKRVRFVGKSQTGWWSGQLDGRPAMGRELNRGHTVYSTTDLKTAFEWWSEGNEHGAY